MLSYDRLNILWCWDRYLMIKTSYDQDILWTRHFLKSCLQLSYDRLLMIVYLWSRHLMIKTNFQELSSIILWSSTYDQDILWSRQILKSCLKLSYDRLQVNTSICWVRYLMIKSSYDQDIIIFFFFVTLQFLVV